MATKNGPKKRSQRKTSTTQLKDEQVRVRLTVEQKDKLVAAARRRALPLSNWLVSLGLREAENDGREGRVEA
jgi:uncharacterized protein (DUF1778 family)